MRFTISNLLKVGSLADSLSVYVPTMALQKGLGLARMIVFLYLMQDSLHEYNLWGLGLMISTVAAPLLNLGSSQGFIRYASLYENAGRLRQLLKLLLPFAIFSAAVAAAAIIFAKPIAIVAIASADQGWDVTPQQIQLCVASLVNALIVALYMNLVSVMYGLRAYRLASAIELLMTVLFAVLGLALIAIWPLGIVAVLSHAFTVAVAGVIGTLLLKKLVNHLETSKPVAQYVEPPLNLPLTAQEPETAYTSSAGTTSAAAAAGQQFAHPMRQIFVFGLAALIGNLLWNSVGYVSYYLTNRYTDSVQAALFNAWMQLGQIVLFLTSAAWSVIFTHVARRWAQNLRLEALYELEYLFKLLAIVATTLSTIIYAAAPIWNQLLPANWQGGLVLFGGLMMFFQVMINLSLVGTIARLHEKPLAIGLVALIGGAFIAVLSVSWITNSGPYGASQAAGVGMFIGGNIAGITYLLITKTRLSAGSYLLLATPIIFLLPGVICLAAWAVMLVIFLFTGIIFTRAQKMELVAKIRSFFSRELRELH